MFEILNKFRKWLSRQKRSFGTIDFLVNNAAGNFVCPAEDLSVNGWNSVVDIVLNGTWYCSQAVGKDGLRKDKKEAYLILSQPTRGVQGPERSIPQVQRRGSWR